MKIKCPRCSKVLIIEDQPGLESKNIVCPVCKEKNSFGNFIKIEEKPQNGDGDHTEYPNSNGGAASSGEHTNYGTATPTVLPDNFCCPQIGRLKVSTSPNISYDLIVGPNIIGRDAPSSLADWKIPESSDKNHISREHFNINVKPQDKGYIHEMTLARDTVNATFINGSQIKRKEECIILKSGDKIKLPDNLVLEFEV